MGGGPCTFALRQHLKAGRKAFATPASARTFDDDLQVVRAMGVEVLSTEAEVAATGAEMLRTRDVDVDALDDALSAFDLAPGDRLAVAVQDHGAAPAGTSDRTFRFQNLKRMLDQGGLLQLAYGRSEIPEYLTRMRGVAESVTHADFLVMDTGPAAVLGALEDPVVRSQERKLIVNAGNGHTLAFHMVGERIIALFEHHTSSVGPEKLGVYLERLVVGDLSNEEVHADGGHGCWIGETGTGPPFLVVTGPRRGDLASLTPRPYFAAPYGDMMLTGCFGLLRAWAEKELPG